MLERKVIICGPPNSGNRLVRAILKRGGADITAKVLHSPEQIKEYGATRAILIVRSQPFWTRKIIKAYETINGMEHRHSKFVLEALQALYPLEPLIVTYEALVAHTEDVAKSIYEYCDIDLDPSIPLEVYDANAR
jgi:hypothetical protein